MRHSHFHFALAVALACCAAPTAFGQYSAAVSQGQASFAGQGGGGYGVYGGGFGGGGYGAGGYGAGGYGAGAGYYGAHPGNLSLIARQSEDVHRQMGDLLNQLRRVQGQQVAVSTPFHTVSDNFFERIGVGFGFNINGAPPGSTGTRVVGLDPLGLPTPSGNLEFRQGGATSAVPPFGGHDPATDGTIGAAILGNQGSLFFNLYAGQGSNRSHVSQTPTVVLQNGTRGAFSDTSQTPFVTGLVPVVGGFAVPRPYYPVMRPASHSVVRDRYRQLQAQQQRQQQLAAAGAAAPPAPRAPSTPAPKLSEGQELSLKLIESQGSTAGHGDLSVAEIKRRRAAQQAREARSHDAEILALIERGKGAEEAGKANVARIYYQQAATRADGDLKQELLQKVESLE